MLNSLMNGTSVPILEKVAQFGQRRHEVLVGNMANIDTVGYRPRDLPVSEFKQALTDAVEQKRINVSGGTSLGDIYSEKVSPTESFGPELFKAIEAPAENITFHDDNNRSIEKEVAKMTKNMMMQNYAVQLISAQFGLMQAVISERA